MKNEPREVCSLIFTDFYTILPTFNRPFTHFCNQVNSQIKFWFTISGGERATSSTTSCQQRRSSRSTRAHTSHIKKFSLQKKLRSPSYRGGKRLRACRSLCDGSRHLGRNTRLLVGQQTRVVKHWRRSQPLPLHNPKFSNGGSQRWTTSAIFISIQPLERFEDSAHVPQIFHKSLNISVWICLDSDETSKSLCFLFLLELWEGWKPDPI